MRDFKGYVIGRLKGLKPRSKVSEKHRDGGEWTRQRSHSAAILERDLERIRKIEKSFFENLSKNKTMNKQ